MNHINSQFIQSLFDEVIIFRPQLKSAATFDDEFEEAADVRLLGDVLIRAFPWPIGVEMRRLFSGSCRNLVKFRLDQIFKTAERTVHFTGLRLFAEVLRLHEADNLQLPDSFVKQLNLRFFTLSFGDLVWLFCECTKLCEMAERFCFLKEISERITPKIQNLLNSVDSDFKSTSIKNTLFTESDSVLLVRLMKDQGQFISHSPFVIDTHGETIDQRDKFNLKKDVFLYSKFRVGHLKYVGTKVTETCDLRVLQSYQRLASEFKLLLEPFNSVAS